MHQVVSGFHGKIYDRKDSCIGSIRTPTIHSLVKYLPEWWCRIFLNVFGGTLNVSNEDEPKIQLPYFFTM